MRGLFAIVIFAWLLGGASPAAAEYLRDRVESWHENTDAAAPRGLGPIKFDMSLAQARRLCKGSWEAPRTPANPVREQNARCSKLPLDLGFEDYEITFSFYRNKLVSVALMKQLENDPSAEAFLRARSRLHAKYGRVPDRTDDYRGSGDPQMERLVEEWGSIYEWRFKRSDVHGEAVQIKLVRFTLDGVPSMLLTYDSQRRQDRSDEMQEQLAKHSGSAY